ncbi:hypothetical protein [Novosphingobium album (ex Liu et al. 2023)]|uniref:Prepilin type IV endopeptidase peptidase domain-containing protein n=1 Tax=Novosphingobium album (ex Liu et al. 2023) TaxID=3031130 RepID=A0ABT5WKD2_9SPHN|nr:hypothetical protein [Novosphingobium album (ex Liu et al. 2023)]MDE8650508.1 hypothetical protein [Novosphingobium album (ex Liu et al. 2023)]
MPGFDYIALAVLILLLLPVVVLPWEGQRVPDLLYAAIAAAGLVAAWFPGGAAGLLLAGLAGLVSLLAVAGAVTFLRIFLGLQILAGSHIKLLAAGSIWLGLKGALIMLFLAFVVLFVAAALRSRRPMARRPDFTAIAAFAIVCVSLLQTLPLSSTPIAPRDAPPADGHPR